MEPTREPLSAAIDATPHAWGELVLQNGRLAGARHPLEAPLILVGRAPSCDIRLHASAIRPIHAALVFSAAGALLREMNGQGGTSINGETAGQRYLHDGDEIAFGPFRFLIRLSEAAGEDSERGAGDHPAATITVQAPDDTPPKADTPPAPRLLVAPAASKKELPVAGNGELEQARQDLLVERRRLFRLRLRLRQRMHRHWAAERAAMRKRQDALDGERRVLEKEVERLHAERQELYRARLQLNGEAELGKRQLRDGWNQLSEERRRFQEQQSRQQAESAARRRELEQREIDVTDAERQLADERRHWDTRRIQLEKEVEGLEVRVRNQRRKLLVQDGELRRLNEARKGENASAVEALLPVAVAPTENVVSAPSPDLQRRLAELDQLATELADQRLYLAEQCERLTVARKKWQQEREAAAATLEPLAQQLDEREEAVREREQALLGSEAEAAQIRQQLAQQQRFLDTWQARLAVRSAVWDGERDRLLEEVRSREEKAESQLAAVTLLRRRWQERSARELENAQKILEACEQLRKECSDLRDHWVRRGKALEQERRSLAERALAVEEYRFTFLRPGGDPAVVEQRLRRLRDRWLGEFESAAQPVVRERQELAADWERLAEGLGQLRNDLTTLATRESEIARRERDHEQLETRNRLEHDSLRNDLARHRAQRDLYERQARALQEEVERLARAMLEDSESAPPLARAA